MRALAEKPDIEESIKEIIYWTSPAFTSNGSVDTKKMIDFLTHRVPNNHFNTEIPNTWNPGEEFEVHFGDPEKKEQVIFRCKLEITGDANNYSVTCTLCEPKNTALSIVAQRSREIAQLISGTKN